MLCSTFEPGAAWWQTQKDPFAWVRRDACSSSGCLPIKSVLLWKWSISEIHKNISNNVYSFSPYKLDGHWGINVYFLQSNGPSYSSRWTSSCEFPACFSFPSRSSWPSSSDHGKGKNLRWRDGQCVSGLISTAVAVRLSSIADLLFDCFILVLKSNQITLGGWEGRQTLTR